MTLIQHNRPIEILLVEDSEADIFLTKEAFQEAKIANRLHIARDGEQALAILKKETPYGNHVTPDLILLDINLPKMSGHEVLQEIKNNGLLKRIPVIALTGSDAERDIIAMYDSQIASYITKPVEMEKFTEVVHAIEDFWFSVVVLPTMPKDVS
ncbi:MAG: response regulator [Pseudomonadota bacterium]